jgi:hypothetical protein
MVKEYSNFKIRSHIKVNGSRVKDVDKEYMFGVMENLIKDSGQMIK